MTSTFAPLVAWSLGYQTAGRSFHELRQEWVDAGAHWASRVHAKPAIWNPYVQMNNAHLFYVTPFSADRVQVPDALEQEGYMEVLAPIWATVPNGATLSMVIK